MGTRFFDTMQSAGTTGAALHLSLSPGDGMGKTHHDNYVRRR
jgi:hypothetical protein